MSDLLEISNLSVEFNTRNGRVAAVSDVSFSIAKGETLGIVGESGSGKSVTSYALMRILDRAGRIAGGNIVYSGIDLRAADETQMRDLRGREISMIFQNPRAALNPIRKVGHQLEDVLLQHAQSGNADARDKAVDLLKLVRIRNPEDRYHSYPFELSGGMCQRIVIALALACQPQLLIADEPTTGLDVTTQKAIMDLIAELTRARGMSSILITHDLGLASNYCDRIIVMQAGKVVESATSQEIFRNPSAPYTRKLILATPRPGCTVRDLLPEDMREMTPVPADTMPSDSGRTPLLKVTNLIKEFPAAAGVENWLRTFSKKTNKDQPAFRAVDGISLEIGTGESLGLVGESGCGKSTTSAMLMRLIDPTSGTIELAGKDIGAIPARQFVSSPLRSQLQMVFQDPTESLNPRFTAARAISDPIRRLGSAEDKLHLNDRVGELATLVGLPLDLLDRFPHQLSGGQKARVGIARAIALNPRLLVLDEPTAALDVSVQAIVLNLLVNLQARFGMSYLFVSHDLNVVRLLCQRVIVMRAGQIVESGRVEDVMTNPRTAYVRELLDAIPHVNA